MTDSTEFVRSQIPGDEGAVVAEIDRLMRRLRQLKRAVQGKNVGDDPDGPPDLFAAAGLVDSGRLGSAIMRLFLDLQRLHYLTADFPVPNLLSFTKRDGEWCYFRAGAPEEAGWRAVDGDARHGRSGDET